jgi:hypothetical protein
MYGRHRAFHEAFHNEHQSKDTICNRSDCIAFAKRSLESIPDWRVRVDTETVPQCDRTTSEVCGEIAYVEVETPMETPGDR